MINQTTLNKRTNNKTVYSDDEITITQSKKGLKKWKKKKKNRFIGILSVYTINLNVVNLAYSFFTFLDIC